jgi:predicted TIM-barrel fold metal-dependent hydrolase
MERMNLPKALLSISSPGVWLGDGLGARGLARSCNEYGASLAERHPDRFGILAALPFPDLGGALEETAFALDHLGLDGVILLSNVDGNYVGDPEFDDLMVELNRRRALVLLHPNHVPENHEDAALHPWVEYPIDVARAYTRLVYNEVLVRFPDIRWILANAGGVVPFLAERLGKAHYAKDGRPRWGRIIRDLAAKRNRGLELAKRMGYDTVGAANPVSFAALRRLVPPEQIYFGSNFPWDSEAATAGAVAFLRQEMEGPLSLAGPEWAEGIRT